MKRSLARSSDASDEQPHGHALATREVQVLLVFSVRQTDDGALANLFADAGNGRSICALQTRPPRGRVRAAAYTDWSCPFACSPTCLPAGLAAR